MKAVLAETPKASNKALLAAILTAHPDWPVGSKETRDARQALRADTEESAAAAAASPWAG